MYERPKRIAMQSLWLAVCIIAVSIQPIFRNSAMAATTLPVLWSAGGLLAGNNSVGQAARATTDAAGNIAVVSGPAFAKSLAVTSYTADGLFRWQQTVAPASGTYKGDWVTATPNGDIVAVGTNVDASGNSFGITLVRYSADGVLLWQKDLALNRPSVARLVADGAGDTYLAFSAIGDGQDMLLYKHDNAGVLVWAQSITTGPLINEIASSLALSPDGAEVVITGSVQGGSQWIVSSFDTATGNRRWLTNRPEGLAARDVVVDGTRVYVTGMGMMVLGGFLEVMAYDRATGTPLWLTNAGSSGTTGTRIALAPDGSLVAVGQRPGLAGGYFNWFIVAMDANGSWKWETQRDLATTGDEIPASVFVSGDGTIVVSGSGGPTVSDALGNSYMQGVTVGYNAGGIPQWEAFSKLPTTWALQLPSGNVCATGGYDGLITCWQTPGAIAYQPPTASLTASSSVGTAPLTVSFTASASSLSANLIGFGINFGDGGSAAYFLGDFGTPSFTTTTSHTYTTPGTYVATVSATDSKLGAATANAIITVNPPVSTVLRSTAINLSATLVRSKVTATGNITVNDSNGLAIASATVSAKWTKPGGSTLTQVTTTGSTGVAKFSTSGNRGTYTLKINSVSKAGYSFDSTKSVLSASITK